MGLIVIAIIVAGVYYWITSSTNHISQQQDNSILEEWEDELLRRNTDASQPPIPSTPPRPYPRWEVGSKVPTIDYDSYIRSDAWLKGPARSLALVRDSFSCTMCGSGNHIEVHHINYLTIGDEDIDYLATLCKCCHGYTHKVAGRGAGNYPPLLKPKDTTC